MSVDLSKEKRWLTDGVISRRDFVQRALAVGLAVPAATALASRVEAATPKRGGVLRAGQSTGSTTNIMDPATFTDWGMYSLGATVCNYLVELDKDKNPVPELAVSWESSNGAKKWVFELRKGVEFHNGKSFTAADVIYSLNRHRGEGATSPAAPYLATVTDIRADGDHTVVMELSEGDADMPAVLGQPQLAIIPDGFTDFANLVGTGGYVVRDFEPGVRFAADRNPNYWKSDRAWFDSYETLSIGDPASRTTALLTGEVNMIDRADAKVIDRVNQRGGFQIIENEGIAYNSSAMDSRAGPFDNNDVRLALKYAVNREELLGKIHRGYGSVANDHPVPPNDPFFNADLPQRPYDPDKARFHLKKAGMENLSVSLSAADAAFNGAVDAAVLFSEQAKAAGIDVDVVREPNDGYWSNVWMAKPFSMVTWGVRATPALQFSIAYACGAPWADGYLCNDRFEMLLKESKVTTDFAKRKEIFGEMQQIQADEGANHVFMFESAVNVVSDNIGGAVPDAAGPSFGFRAAERLWMTS